MGQDGRRKGYRGSDTKFGNARLFALAIGSTIITDKNNLIVVICFVAFDKTPHSSSSLAMMMMNFDD